MYGLHSFQSKPSATKPASPPTKADLATLTFAAPVNNGGLVTPPVVGVGTIRVTPPEGGMGVLVTPGGTPVSIGTG
jgi:hypothetical protein